MEDETPVNGGRDTALSNFGFFLTGSSPPSTPAVLPWSSALCRLRDPVPTSAETSLARRVPTLWDAQLPRHGRNCGRRAAGYVCERRAADEATGGTAAPATVPPRQALVTGRHTVTRHIVTPSHRAIRGRLSTADVATRKDAEFTDKSFEQVGFSGFPEKKFCMKIERHRWYFDH